MIKYFLSFSFIFLIFSTSFAQNIDIQEDIKIGFVCELEKKILKNSEYNYQTFLAKDLTEKKLDKFEIDAKQPEKLLINGLSTFLSKNTELDVKVVNKDIVLFKAFDEEKNYSESGICLLYTSDAADDSLRVDLGGRRIIKKGSLSIHRVPRSPLRARLPLGSFFQAEDGIRDS